MNQLVQPFIRSKYNQPCI